MTFLLFFDTGGSNNSSASVYQASRKNSDARTVADSKVEMNDVVNFHLTLQKKNHFEKIFLGYFCPPMQKIGSKWSLNRFLQRPQLVGLIFQCIKDPKIIKNV